MTGIKRFLWFGVDDCLAWIASALAALALMAMLTSCSVHSCTLIGCISSAGFVVHVDASRDVLDHATYTVCRNDACGTGSPGSSPDAGTGAPLPPAPTGTPSTNFVISGIGLAATAKLSTTSDVRTTLWINVDLTSPEPHDGDSYTIHVADAQGTSLLDFSRSIRYVGREINGPGCGVCTSASVQVWPTSPSGLTCDAKSCPAGTTVTLRTSNIDDQLSNARLSICRNDVCSTGTWLGLAPMPGAVTGLSLTGDLGGGVQVTTDGHGHTDFTFRIDELDPAVLADGDVYRADITAADGTTSLASIVQPAAYTESYPNGSTCDPYPCRSATLGP